MVETWFSKSTVPYCGSCSQSHGLQSQGTRFKGKRLKAPDIHAVVVVAFSLCARILGECSTIYSPPALFFKVEISLHKLIPLFRLGSVHSGSTSWDNCDREFPDELHVSSFPDRSHTLPGQRHGLPTCRLLGNAIAPDGFSKGKWPTFSRVEILYGTVKYTDFPTPP